MSEPTVLLLMPRTPQKFAEFMRNSKKLQRKFAQYEDPRFASAMNLHIKGSCATAYHALLLK